MSTSLQPSCPNFAALPPPQLAEQLNKMMQNGFKTVAVYASVTLILVFIMAFCIHNIVSIVQFYKSHKKAVQETAERTKRSKTNNPMDRRDDDEVYIHQQELSAENDDEYVRYTEQINKSVSEFKVYNEKLKAYYKDNKPGETPQDLIDETIITNDADNY